MERSSIETLLRDRIGLDPASAGPGFLVRAVRARMSALGLGAEDEPRYLALLGDSEAEREALVEEVVVPESWFFRDEHPFRFLAERLAPQWLADASLAPLRALSIPCAGGEEPYSIAITLLEAGLPPERIVVDAVDVSRRAIEAARIGRYTPNAFRARHAPVRSPFFQPVGSDVHEVDTRVKTIVQFRVGNILDDALLRGQPAYDAVFCRNLLIYLDQDARRQAFRNLDRFVGRGGVLFIGHADPIRLLAEGRYRLAGEARTFAYQRAAVEPASGNPGSAGAPASRFPVRRNVGKPPAVRLTGGAAPPAMPVAVPPSRRGDEPANRSVPFDALDEARRLADQGRHEEAAAACERTLRIRPTAIAYTLLGMIRQAAGRSEDAEQCFERAVYLDAHHEEALLALALLAERRGNVDQAAKYRRRAERAFQEKASP